MKPDEKEDRMIRRKHKTHIEKMKNDFENLDIVDELVAMDEAGKTAEDIAAAFERVVESVERDVKQQKLIRHQEKFFDDMCNLHIFIHGRAYDAKVK